jgi:hypothetical protein
VDKFRQVVVTKLKHLHMQNGTLFLRKELKQVAHAHS